MSLIQSGNFFCDSKAFSKAQTFSVLSLSNRKSKKSGSDTKFVNESMMDFGYLVAQPFLKSEAKSDGLWMGRYADVAGVATFGCATGLASYQDSAKTIYARGLFAFFGFQKCYSLLKNNFVDVNPLFGMGFQYNRMENIAKAVNFRTETGGVGVYVSGGIGITLGPISVKAKVQAITSINFNKANLVKGNQAIPSVTLGIRPGKSIFDPDHLTVAGVHYMQEKINEKYSVSGNTLYHSYDIKTTYVPGTVTASDVRPYFFIGPTFAGSADPYQILNPRTMGLCMGFRKSYFYIEGSFERGNFNFMDPVMGNFFTNAPKPTNKNYASPRMDGVFVNSSRVGMKLGVDLVSIGKKKGFIPYSREGKRKLSKLTSYYAIIPTFGFGNMHLGPLQFADSAQGLTAYKNYLTNSGKAADSTVAFTSPGWKLDNTGYTSFGITLMLGAVSFDYNIFRAKLDGKKTAVTTTWGVSYKLPLFRLLRYGKAKKLQKKYDAIEKTAAPNTVASNTVTSNTVTSNTVALPAFKLTKDEEEFVALVNEVRTEPQKFAERNEEYLKKKAPAFLASLKTAKPIPAIKVAGALCTAAQKRNNGEQNPAFDDNGRFCGMSSGGIGGNDRDSLRIITEMYRNILSPDYTHVGVNIQNETKTGTITYWSRECSYTPPRYNYTSNLTVDLSEVDDNKINTAKGITYMTAQEIEMVKEINFARCYPKIYAALV
ncbi:MAG: hypothetical protein IAF38_11035, partial [Bacteroidia bacterium]|nr:hypothetical protein [Bacteroidia bacterium]